MRYMFTDDLWAAMAPLVERADWYKGGQPPQVSDRALSEALLYLARTGTPWPGLPAEFGRSAAV